MCRTTSETTTVPPYFYDADEVAAFHADFRQMTKVSLNEAASVTLIKRAIKETAT